MQNTGKELLVTYQNILVSVQPNPYVSKVTNTGVIVDLGGKTINKNTNEIEDLVEDILYGVVLEVGPKVEGVMKDDGVFFHKHAARPVPFFSGGFLVLNEGNVLAFVREP